MFGRFVDWILALIALIGIVCVGAWAVYSSGQGAKQLENKLQKQASDVLLDNGYDWANITLDGQHAILSGQSPGDGAAAGAIEALEASGLLGGAIAGPITNLTDEVFASAPISPYLWSVEKTRAGQLVLSGYAPDRSTIDALLENAEVMAPGEVENRLKIGNGQPQGDWLMVAHKAFLQLESLQYGRADLIDTTLRIEGVAAVPDAREKIRSGLDGIDRNFDVELDVRSAGAWSAFLNAGTLTLNGIVADEAERQAILDLVGARFQGSVVDQMTVTPHEHDNWLPGLRTILPHFLGFESGFVVVDPQEGQYRVSGEAVGSVIAFLREDTADISPYVAVIEAVAVEAEVAEIAGLDFSGDRLAACQAAFRAVLANNRVNFESGRANIDRSSGNTLDKLTSVARRCDELIFEVGGHTDSQGDRGSNITLSRSRAQAVADYMIARGIAADQIDAIGFGPDVPVADNDTSDGRAANRRIEFKVIEGG